MFHPAGEKGEGSPEQWWLTLTYKDRDAPGLPLGGTIVVLGTGATPLPSHPAWAVAYARLADALVEWMLGEEG